MIAIIRCWALGALLTAGVASAAPVVKKVEPPNWWANQAESTVRVLITGSGFRGAEVRSHGLDVLGAHTDDTGAYLFVDVKVHKAGDESLEIRTPEGSVTAPFPVLAPLDRTGRFQGFSSEDVMYLIVTDRFADGDTTNDDPAESKGLFDRNKPRYYHGGDFQGIIDHLPYLKSLGITTMWITPVYDNSNRLNDREKYRNEPVADYHGYGAVDFYKVEEHFGTIEKLRELVDKAHASGIKVVLDMVVNHTGPSHPWVGAPPKPTWFHGTAEKHLNETWKIWTLMDPHSGLFTRAPVLDGWFLNILPDLNQNDPDVAQYLIQNTLWWVASTGIDGIRADTVPYVPRKFWRDWTAALKKDYPNLRVVGEVFDGDPAVTSFFQGGQERFDHIDSGIDTVFDFPSYFAIRSAFGQGKTVMSVPYMLAHDWMYKDPSALVTFLGNHDVTRFMNENGATVDGLKLAFTYLMTTRGMPTIYYGDELAMHGGTDPDNRRDFPGGWAGDTHNAFTPEGRTKAERDIFDYVQRLIQLRAELPDLRHADFTQVGVTDTAWIYTRGAAIVILNNGTTQLHVETPASQGTWHDVIGLAGNIAVRDDVLKATVPPRTASILVKR